MQKVLGITTFIVGGLLVLGACGSPAAKATATPSPAATTPTAPVPAATTPTAPVPAATTPAAPAPVAATPVAPAPVAATPLAPAPVAATPVAPAPTPVPAQTSVTGAAFTTSNLKITPSKVTSGSEVTVTARIKNIGTQAGTYSVVMEMKGDDEACPMISPIVTDVTLAAGATGDVKFNVLMPKGFGGGFTVTVGSQKGSLIVDD